MIKSIKYGFKTLSHYLIYRPCIYKSKPKLFNGQKLKVPFMIEKGVEKESCDT